MKPNTKRFIIFEFIILMPTFSIMFMNILNILKGEIFIIIPFFTLSISYMIYNHYKTKIINWIEGQEQIEDNR